jgi:hypothetical protein
MVMVALRQPLSCPGVLQMDMAHILAVTLCSVNPACVTSPLLWETKVVSALLPIGPTGSGVFSNEAFSGSHSGIGRAV